MTRPFDEEVSPAQCGFITVLGQANAGKSTLINTLVGEKVSIVSAKAHTTRYEIYGICNQGQAQMILIDTPGLISHPQGPLHRFMSHTMFHSLEKAHQTLLVVDSSKPLEGELRTFLRSLSPRPLSIALNKIDRVHKPQLLALAESLKEFSPHILMISGQKKQGLEPLIAHLKRDLPQAPWLFSPQSLTQVSKKFWVSEITREKVFSCVHEEIPYHTHVVTSQWKERGQSLVLHQTIMVDKSKYRQLILGHQGRRIRIIGAQARQDLMSLLQKPVHLFLKVEVDPTWITTLT